MPHHNIDPKTRRLAAEWDNTQTRRLVAGAANELTRRFGENGIAQDDPLLVVAQSTRNRGLPGRRQAVTTHTPDREIPGWRLLDYRVGDIVPQITPFPPLNHRVLPSGELEATTHSGIHVAPSGDVYHYDTPITVRGEPVALAPNEPLDIEKIPAERVKELAYLLGHAALTNLNAQLGAFDTYDHTHLL